jgi:thiamine-phosphate pyrophosphorylase
VSFGRKLVHCCHHYHVPRLCNDDIHLAAAVNADGVHLGKEDGDIQQAREILQVTMRICRSRLL